MSDYSIVPNAALSATADAIREKSGSQATIEFDHNTGFADAIEAIPSSGGPDLSNDTVTTATLLEGETAHNSSGAPITGELAGTDLFEGTLRITFHLSSALIFSGVPSWNSTTKKITHSNTIVQAGDSERTFAIPTSFSVLLFAYSSSKPIEITDLSSSVAVMNNGDPIFVTGSTYQYAVRVSGSSSAERSFTVSSVS